MEPVNEFFSDSKFGAPIREQFTNKDGLTLQSYTWLSNGEKNGGIKGAVVLIHGVTSHVKFEFLNHNYNPKEPMANSRYLSYSGSWIEKLNQFGYDVHCYDQQSHGESEGWEDSRANVKCFDDLVFDCLQYLLLVCSKYKKGGYNYDKSKNPPRLFLAGLSMGGGVVLRTTQLWRFICRHSAIPASEKHLHNGYLAFKKENKPKIDVSNVIAIDDCKTLPLRGLIVLAPNLSIESLKKQLLNRILLPLNSPISHLSPHAKVASLSKNIMFPWIEEDRLRDKLMYNDKMEARITHENINCGTWVKKDKSLLFDLDQAGDSNQVAEGPFSVLLIHSSDDGICDAEGSISLNEELKGHVQDLDLWIISGMFHYLIVEPNNESLRDRVVDWIVSRSK